MKAKLLAMATWILAGMAWYVAEHLPNEVGCVTADDFRGPASDRLLLEDEVAAMPYRQR